jgi:hypothetical protein
MNVPFDYSIDERTLTTIKHLMQKQLNLLKDGEKIKLSALSSLTERLTGS